MTKVKFFLLDTHPEGHTDRQSKNYMLPNSVLGAKEESFLPNTVPLGKIVQKQFLQKGHYQGNKVLTFESL